MGAACSSGSTADTRAIHSATIRTENGSIGQREDNHLSAADRTPYPLALAETSLVGSAVSPPSPSAAVARSSSATSSSTPPITTDQEQGSRSAAERNIELILQRTRSGVALDASAGFSLSVGPNHHHQCQQQELSFVGGAAPANHNSHKKLSEDISMRLDMLAHMSKSGSARVDGYSSSAAPRSARNSARQQRSTTYFGGETIDDRLTTMASSIAQE